MVFVVFTVKCEWKSIPVFNRGSFKQEKLKSVELKYVTAFLVFQKA